jgi:hypothetical protein
MGEVFLDAWEATADPVYLDAARKAADALVAGQQRRGGWHYFIDSDPKGIPAWYKASASRFRWGYEEYRHYYGNATFDDRVTPDAAQFLLRFYRVTKDPNYRKPVLKALDFVLAAQYPNGAWPQRFPLKHDFAHDGLPDYTSFYTLNDGATLAAFQLLVNAWETLGDSRYLDGARRGVEAVMRMQGPQGQGGWGEQHGPDFKPIAARTHEPAGYVLRESVFSIRMLQEFYLLTGETKYLEPVPRCLDWFERINREIAEQKYPPPRYGEPGSNRPLYVVRTDKPNAEGYGLYVWTTDPAKEQCDNVPCKGDGQPLINVDPMRRTHERIAATTTKEARAELLARMRARPPRAPRGFSAEQALLGLDARGAWVTNDNSVPVPSLPSGLVERETVRGYNTQVFVANLSGLIAELRSSAKP